MLSLPGSRKSLCSGITRRDLLHIGAAGAFAPSLADAMRAEAAPVEERARPERRAKSAIFLFLFGSPPQHETFDPKPEAAAEIQGEMKAIDTSLPGLQIGEGLPQIAGIADKLTVVRSMTHPYPIHCCAYVMSGMPTYGIPLETQPRAPEHWPYMGSWITSKRNSLASARPAFPGTSDCPGDFVRAAVRRLRRVHTERFSAMASTRSGRIFRARAQRSSRSSPTVSRRRFWTPTAESNRTDDSAWRPVASFPPRSHHADSNRDSICSTSSTRAAHSFNVTRQRATGTSISSELFR